MPIPHRLTKKDLEEVLDGLEYDAIPPYDKG